MPVLRDICDWCARVLQNLQNFWSMMVNMLIHDYRYNWGDSPLVIRVEDVESSTSRMPNTNLESMREKLPIMHYTVETHRSNDRQRMQCSQLQRSESDSDDDNGRSPLYLMYQPRPHINYSTNPNDLSLPSTSKM